MELISLVAFYIFQCPVCNVKLHPLLTCCVCVCWAVLKDCMDRGCRVEAIAQAVVHLLGRHVGNSHPRWKASEFWRAGPGVDEGCDLLPRYLGSW